MDWDSVNRQVKAAMIPIFALANSIFHLNISDAVQLAVIGGLTTAIAMSQVKTIADNKAKAAADAVKTTDDAAAVLGGAVVK